MKIFVLGGYGKVGLQTAEILAESDLVSEVAIAGRNMERAAKAAAGIGEKAISVRADGTNEIELTSLLAGYDILLNAGYDDAVLPAIRAAIRTGTHYCDANVVSDDALRLSSEAISAGIAAITSTGISPCISNLMGLHAASRLDKVEQLQIGRAEIVSFDSGRELSPRQWSMDPQENLAALRKFGSFIGFIFWRVQEGGIRPVLNFQCGHWVEVNPLNNDLTVPSVKGGRTAIRPYMSGDDLWGMLPEYPSRAKQVEMWFSPFPSRLGTAIRELVKELLKDEIDAEAATSALYSTIEHAPEYWLASRTDHVPPTRMWIDALGRKDGRASRSSCWFTAPMWEVNGYYLTSVSLAVSVMKLLRGDIESHGVMTAETAFEPLAYFDEVVALLPNFPSNAKLINESFEWLD